MDYIKETLEHISHVQRYLAGVIADLLARSNCHDYTKFEPIERGLMEKHMPEMAGMTYNSPEYKAVLEKMKPALEHHYSSFRHHPEHFEDGMVQMNLVDLIEMICDWKAASMRHNDGSIWKSIEINQKRFGYSDELKRVFENTAAYLWGNRYLWDGRSADEGDEHK